MPDTPSAKRSILSTATPACDSVLASSGTGTSTSTCSRSQASGTLIATSLASRYALRSRSSNRQSPELLEEAQIAVEQQTHVRDAEARERHAVHAHAEGEARVAL